MKKAVLFILFVIGCAQLESHPERQETFKVPAGNVIYTVPTGFAEACDDPLVTQELSASGVDKSEYISCLKHVKSFEDSRGIVYVSIPGSTKAMYVSSDEFERYKWIFVNTTTNQELLAKNEDSLKQQFELSYGVEVRSYRIYNKGFIINLPDRFLLKTVHEILFKNHGELVRVQKISGRGFYLADGSIVRVGYSTVVNKVDQSEFIEKSMEHLIKSMSVSI